GGALWCTDRQGSVLWSSAAPACQKFDVDAMGVVQGVQNLSQPSSPSMSSANRLRVFHRKRQLRVQQQAAKDPWMPSVACVHPNGFVSWNLPSPKLSPCAAPLTPRKLPLRAPSCRIDPEGHVHDLAGMTPPMSPADSWRTSGRLKLFHRKRHQRLQPASAGAWKLSIDLDGEMHWTMGPEEIDFVRAHSGATTPSMDWNQLERKMSMDSEGVLQRKMSLDSEGVLNLSTLQSPGFRRQRSCSLDSEGIVHDLEAPVGNLYSPASGGVHDRASVDRLKLFHRKRVSRGQVQGSLLSLLLLVLVALVLVLVLVLVLLLLSLSLSLLLWLLLLLLLSLLLLLVLLLLLLLLFLLLSLLLLLSLVRGKTLITRGRES
ncbi:unnamed protein product, partial [Polarella glacialis]